MVKVNFKKIIKYVTTTTVFMAISLAVKYSAMFCINNNIKVSNNVFELLFVKNRGAAFSLFDTHTDSLIVLSWVVLAGIVGYVVKKSNKLSLLKINALATLTAGVSGNLYERIHDGFVTDYIHLTFYNFPVFNASDILISIGTVLLIIALYVEK